ncbi:MAG: radical SAM protein, partial [Spirochaetaceae bacterium]|nr:radical SAM protein [Spirochaetaceae bacterium]
MTKMPASPLVFLIQPPFVQLNAPYPSIYYLKTFCETLGLKTLSADHSIELFHRIFSKEGLAAVFAEAERSAGEKNPAALSMLSGAGLWVSIIDRLIDFLSGRDREFGHLIGLANGALPAGPLLISYLESVDGDPPDGAARLMAGKMLADLAGFINTVLDPSFALIRYGRQMEQSIARFDEVLPALDGFIIRNFYLPLLEETWTRLEAEWNFTSSSPLILALTVPFPGCLAGALRAAASAKARFGDRAVVILGGGYVNTELRFLDDERIFDYVDYLSFDRGYGSLRAILNHRGVPLSDIPYDASSDIQSDILYKTMYRQGKKIISGLDAGRGSCAETDRRAVKEIFPDYTGVDFSRYLYPVDDENPMHRLWSDGHWLKAYLAHGCYWHSCAFCDVDLDYIRGFEPVHSDALFAHLVRQAELSGVRSVHLVDEAVPVNSLVRFASLNLDAGLPLVFWGNIRFEKDFSPDIAALLASGGLIGVSAGIEIAAEQGFARIGKGIDLEAVVRACAAFKEAGILTHAYLIYGYWDQSDEELIDSAEILRQLFEAGLLDSAFWHKFILTRHSRVYREWKNGRHKELRVRETTGRAGKTFACNDLCFAGEEYYERYCGGLEKLLSSWMQGFTSDEVSAAFDFKVPCPGVDKNTVAKLLDRYARDRDDRRRQLPGAAGKAERLRFLGSKPIITGTNQIQLSWRWQFAEHRLTAKPRPRMNFAALRELFGQAGSGMDAATFYAGLTALLAAGEAERTWAALRQG